MIKVRLFVISTLLCAILFLGVPALAQPQSTLDNAQIQKILMDYNEPGYKFLEKLDTGMWKVLYARPGWDFGWEVIVTSTGQTPESALLVIGTTVTATDKINSTFLMQLLDENSFDTNPGSYSIFYQDEKYFVQYAVKLPQSLISEDVLKEAIGFVAGYSNSRVKVLESMLNPNPSPDNSKSEAPAGSAPAQSNTKTKISFPDDSAQPPAQNNPPAEETD